MAASFAERWASREAALGLEEIASPMISFESVVLPASAAPCLSFADAAKPISVYEAFASPEDWSAEDRSRLERFLVIGHDGAGNPICVEVDSGKIVLLDHEDRFRSQQFVNSSVSQLAECLLTYMGEDNSAHFESLVLNIDPNALSEGAFWNQEMKGIESDA